MRNKNDINAIMLDTHVWFWIATGDETVLKKPKVKELIMSLHKYPLLLASISLWEISMLESKGRIHLKTDSSSWLRESVRKTKVKIIPIIPEIAADSTTLPGNFHGDPADRLIVAAARNTNALLLTRDKKIIDYGKKGYVNHIAV